ncbi:MAG: hypothetical protein HC883_03575 [Bdellovibrionaceae bacterium]|nr:hypothetical protein [Pseudobdellovibrionaceae bacterium]
MFGLKFVFILLIACGATACGQFSASDSSSSEGASPLARKPYGTCDRKAVPTIHLCTEAVGSDYNEPGYLDILRSSCESSGGVFSTDICDPQESFGTCVVGAGQPNLAYVSYYPPEYTAESAQTACEDTAGGIYYAR